MASVSGRFPVGHLAISESPKSRPETEARLARRIGRKSRLFSLRLQGAFAKSRNSGAFFRRREIPELAGLAGCPERIRTHICEDKLPFESSTLFALKTAKSDCGDFHHLIR